MSDIGTSLRVGIYKKWSSRTRSHHKKPEIKVVTRYQNLIKNCCLTRSGYQESEGIKRTIRLKRLPSIRTSSRIGTYISGYLEQEVHLKELENKSVYSVSEPQQVPLLTKVVTWNQKFITKNQKIRVITRYQNLVKVYF